MNYKVTVRLSRLWVWSRYLGIFSLICLALYAFLGFIVVPEVLQREIQTLKLPLGRPVSIEKVSINPFAMTLSLQNLQILEPDKTPFLAFRQLTIDVALFESLQNQMLTTTSVQLRQPVLQLHRNRESQLNIADLIALATQSETNDQDAPLLYYLQHLEIIEGKIGWLDDSKTIHTEESIYPLNLVIDHIHSQANQRSEAQLNVEFASGGTLFWQGDFSLKPIESQGFLRLKNLDMHRIWQIFLQGHVPFNITQGRHSAELSYQMRHAHDGVFMTAENIQVEFNQFNVLDPDQHTLLKIHKLQAQNGQFDLSHKQIRFDRVQLDQMQGHAWLDENGVINYQTLFPAQAQAESQSAGSQPSSDWRIQIPQISGQALNLTLTDSTRSPPVTHTLTNTTLDIQHFDNQSQTQMAIAIQTLVNRHSTLALTGSLGLEPLQSELNVEIKNLLLPLLMPYQPESIKLICTSGWLDSQWQVHLKRRDDIWHVSASASGTLNDFSLKHPATGKTPLQWQQLKLDSLQYTWPNPKLFIKGLILDQPYLQAQINPDKTLNWQAFISSEDSNDIPDAQTTQPLAFTIDHIQIQNGGMAFSDASLQFPFHVRMQDLTGDLWNLSSHMGQSAKLKVSGQLDSLTPVTIDGLIRPAHQEANLNLHFKNLSLPSVTPYMIEFAGRKIQKGKMKLDLHYLKADQTLTLSNQILIEQLVLGESVPSPHAVSLPLDFVLALLQDNQGNIQLDVPIRGSLDQPDFDFGALIGDGLVNLVNKWVTSPFSAIASLFESDEAEQVQFAAGLPTLSVKAEQKLSEWAQALQQRPELQLEITGYAVADWDSRVLQEQKLEKALQALMPADGLSTDSLKSQWQQALATLFLQKHPELGDKSLTGEPRLHHPEQGDFYVVAETVLRHDLQPDRNELQNLAQIRADQVAAYLLHQGIEADRIFVLESQVDADEIIEGRVVLNLTRH